jgi:hypothetical protein
VSESELPEEVLVLSLEESPEDSLDPGLEPVESSLVEPADVVVPVVSAVVLVVVLAVVVVAVDVELVPALDALDDEVLDVPLAPDAPEDVPFALVVPTGPTVDAAVELTALELFDRLVEPSEVGVTGVELPVWSLPHAAANVVRVNKQKTRVGFEWFIWGTCG